jgi:branched-chain amino acid transport system ATP-binding protein
VEQFANTALAVADFAAVMTHGKIVAVGQPQDIEEHVSAAYLGGAA